MQSHAGIAIFEQIEDSRLAVWKISVTRNQVELSGAWILRNESIDDLLGMLENDLYVGIGPLVKKNPKLNSMRNNAVDINEFLKESASEVAKAQEKFQEFVLENTRLYQEYMSIELAARKLLPKVQKKQLVGPTFSEWPQDIDLENASIHLRSLGKPGLAEISENQASNILSAAHLVKLFIQMWQSDELERKNKLYIDDVSAEVTILPKSWINKLPNQKS
jgi:hypothetical protein